MVEHGFINLPWQLRGKKEQRWMFTATEQCLLLETYEEFKHMISKKGNIAAINKTREKGWQEIADHLNA